MGKGRMVKTRVEGRRMERGKWWGARRPATSNGPSRCEKGKRGGDKGADFRHSAAEPLDFAGGIYGKSR